MHWRHRVDYSAEKDSEAEWTIEVYVNGEWHPHARRFTSHVSASRTADRLYDDFTAWRVIRDPGDTQRQIVADHIAVMKDGGRWVMPRSNCVVTFDKQNHTYTMTGRGMNKEIVQVLDALGWEESRPRIRGVIT